MNINVSSIVSVKSNAFKSMISSLGNLTILFAY